MYLVLCLYKPRFLKKSSSWNLLIQTLNNIQNKNTQPNQFIICHMGCKNHILHEPARKGHVLGGVYTSHC